MVTVHYSDNYSGNVFVGSAVRMEGGVCTMHS